MSTNTLLQDIIGALRNLRLDMPEAQRKHCDHALDSLCKALFWTPPEPSEENTDPSLCLEKGMKPPIEDLLDEIDLTFEAICNSVCAGPEVIKRLQKALKHLNKALIILEGEDD